MRRHFRAPTLLSAGLLCCSVHAATPSLVVVEDRGGASALPYYRALNLQPNDAARGQTGPALQAPPLPAGPYREADMLPVRSALLTPGAVERRVIHAAGLRPLFLVGDDERSRAWLRQRGDSLRKLGAVGLVVNVESSSALEQLRQLASGLSLSPVAGDDLARRLGLHHYPALVTATGIEP